MKTAAASLPIQVLQAFETVPDLYLILSPDLVMLTASNAYLAATSTHREAIVGKPVFALFPDQAELTKSLASSLQQVLATKKPHQMVLQRSDGDLPKNGGDTLSTHYWLPLNTPVLDAQGDVYYIIHKLEKAPGRERAEGILLEEPFRRREIQARQVALRVNGDTDRHATEKYRALLASVDEGYFLCEVLFDETDSAVDILYLEANPAAARMVGQDFTGRRLREINSNYEPFWYEIFGRVARTGNGERLEQYAEPDQKWYSFYVSKVGNGDSRQVAVIFQNITERKRREANLAFLAEIADEISRLSTAEEILETVGAKIGAYLEVKSCLFVDVDDERGEVTVFDAWNTADVPSLRYQTIRLSDFISEEFAHANRSGEGAVVRDTGTDPRSSGRDYSELGICSFVTIPFHRHGVWTNYLAVTHSEPRDWREDEIELFRELSNRIFPRLERARAEEKLRRAAERDAFRIQLADALRPLSDPVEIQTAACRLLCEHLHAQRVNYADIEGDEFIIRCSYTRGVAPITGRGPIATYPHALLEEYRRHGAIAVNDVATDPRFSEQARANYAKDNIAASASVMLIKAGRWVASFAAHSSTPRQWTADERVLVHETAERIWVTVERARAEEALRQSEERLRITLEAAEMGTWDWNLGNGEVIWNDRHFQLFGLEPRPEPRTVGDFERHVHPEDRARVMEKLREAVEGNLVFKAEFRALTVEGETRWMSGYGQTTEKTPDGKPVRMCGVMLDITERTRAEHALQESERIYRSRLEQEVVQRTAELKESKDLLHAVAESQTVSLSAFKAIRDASGEIVDLEWVFANSLTERFANDRQLVGRRYSDVAGADLPDQYRRVIQSGQPRDEEFPHGHQGVEGWFRRIVVKLGDGILVSQEDITDRKRLDAEHLQLKLSQQKQLLNVILQTQEAERSRIGNDLHDGLGQLLYATKLHLESLGYELRRTEPFSAAAFQSAFQKIDLLLIEAIDQNRTLAYQLMPVVLKEYGLEAALSDLLERIKLPGLSIQLVVKGLGKRLAEDKELGLFRITQELIANVIKHAHATQARVEIHRTGQQLRVRVTDNGSGLTPKSASRGMGLQGIQNRLQLLGGKVTFRAVLPQGTQVSVQIPL